jgi:hypothetical protein
LAGIYRPRRLGENGVARNEFILVRTCRIMGRIGHIQRREREKKNHLKNHLYGLFT